MGRGLGFESGVERDRLVTLDFDRRRPEVSVPAVTRHADDRDRAGLRQALHELVLRLDSDQGPDRRRRTAGLVEQLARPAAGFLQPSLEELLHRYVAADDSVARDQIARVLAGACGTAALPALLRALVGDRNDDGDTLQCDVLAADAPPVPP